MNAANQGREKYSRKNEWGKKMGMHGEGMENGKLDAAGGVVLMESYEELENIVLIRGGDGQIVVGPCSL